jgi:hypothetical protein
MSVCVSWCFAWNLAAAPDISKVVSTYSRHKRVCVCHWVVAWKPSTYLIWCHCCHYPGEGLLAVGFRNFLHKNPNPNPNPIWVGKVQVGALAPSYLPTRLGTSKSNPPKLHF